MKLQTFGLILLLVVLGEFIQTRDAYKSIRPYKYYRPRPRGHKPRWPPFPQPSRYRHFKKGPPKAHYRPPNSAWNRPRYAADHIKDEQSYTIEIELPKRQQSHSRINDRYHNKHCLRENSHDFYDDDDDYLDEDEEFEERVLQTGKKKVRVKVIKGIKPKLRIKISRADIPADMEFATSRIGKPSMQRNLSLPNNKFGQIRYGGWMLKNSVPSFPEALRGA